MRDERKTAQKRFFFFLPSFFLPFAHFHILAMFDFLFCSAYTYARSAFFLSFLPSKKYPHQQKGGCAFTMVCACTHAHTGVTVSWERRVAASF